MQLHVFLHFCGSVNLLCVQSSVLLQVITYIMPNGVKTHVEERVVREVVRGMTPPGDSDLWESVAITVPPLVPANVHLTCRLLRVSYRIDVSSTISNLKSFILPCSAVLFPTSSCCIYVTNLGTYTSLGEFDCIMVVGVTSYGAYEITTAYFPR